MLTLILYFELKQSIILYFFIIISLIASKIYSKLL